MIPQIAASAQDEMHNWLLRAVGEQGLRPTIPDYALDMHTARHTAMGHTLQHLLKVGAQINPELHGRDRTYQERLLETVKG